MSRAEQTFRFCYLASDLSSSVCNSDFVWWSFEGDEHGESESCCENNADDHLATAGSDYESNALRTSAIGCDGECGGHVCLQSAGGNRAGCGNTYAFHDVHPQGHQYVQRCHGECDDYGEFAWTAAPSNSKLTLAFAGNGTGAVVSTPAGISCRTGSSTGCSASFAPGTSIKLAVTPDASMVLAGWQGGGCSGSAPTCALALSADTNIVVTLNQAPAPPPANAQLTVIESGGGQGSVVSDPSGINCPGTCTVSFPEGTQLTLTATAANGSVFGGYTGACTTQGAKAKDAKKHGNGSPSPTCTFKADGNESVTAVFTTVQPPPPPPPTSPLSVSISGEGSVTSSPAGIDCPTTCNASFPQGTVVTLTPNNSAKGWLFRNWTGACTTSEPTCQVTITNTNQSVTAVFF